MLQAKKLQRTCNIKSLFEPAVEISEDAGVVIDSGVLSDPVASLLLMPLSRSKLRNPAFN